MMVNLDSLVFPDDTSGGPSLRCRAGDLRFSVVLDPFFARHGGELFAVACDADWTARHGDPFTVIFPCRGGLNILSAIEAVPARIGNSA